MADTPNTTDTPRIPEAPEASAVPSYNINIYGSAQGVAIGDNAKVNNSFNDQVLSTRSGRKEGPFLAPPPPIYELVGRDNLIGELKARLFVSKGVALSAFKGSPGVGKTVLALTIVYDGEVKRHFAEGILWASLGQQGDPVSQLTEWCHALGVPTVVPKDQDPLEVLGKTVRRAIGMRRMLLVVDDAWSIKNALALKVGGPFCAYIVTTRLHEVALHFSAESTVTLQELNEEDGLLLLSRLAPKAVDADRAEARALVQAVGGLPLAITLIGGYLRKESHTGQRRRIRQAIERLKDAMERLSLEETQTPTDRHPSLPQDTPLSLKTVIKVSVEALDEVSRQGLHKLILCGPKPLSFSERAAKQVARIQTQTLDTLVDASLLEVVDGERYTMHQTIFDYMSAQPVTGEDIYRFIKYYSKLLADHQKDYERIEAELSNILRMLQLAGQVEENMVFVTSITNLMSYLNAKAHYPLCYDLLYKAEAVAITTDFKKGLAQVYRRLGILADLRHDFADAAFRLHEGLRIARELQDEGEQAAILSNLAVFEMNQGNHAVAEEHIEEALRLERLHNTGVLNNLLTNRGASLLRKGEYEEARECFQEALAYARRKRDKEGMSHSLFNLALVEHYLGRKVESDRLIREGLKQRRSSGNYRHLAQMLGMVADIAVREEKYQQARVLYEEALDFARKSTDPFLVSRTLGELAYVITMLKDHEQAQLYVGEAMKLAQEYGDKKEKYRTLDVASYVTRQAGDLRGAEKYADMALAIAHELEDSEGVCRQLVGLEKIALAEGNFNRAADYLRDATKSCSDAEDVHHIATAFGELGQAVQDAGDLPTALQYHQEGIGLARQGGFDDVTALLLLSLGDVAKEAGDGHLAEKSYQDSFDLAWEHSDKETANIALLHAGSYYLGQGMRLEAASTFHRVIELSEQEDPPTEDTKKRIGFSYYQLGLLVEEQGDKEAARMYGKQALGMLAAVLDEGNEGLLEIRRWLSTLDERL